MPLKSVMRHSGALSAAGDLGAGEPQDGPGVAVSVDDAAIEVEEGGPKGEGIGELGQGRQAGHHEGRKDRAWTC